MQTYQRKFIELSLKKGVLKFGSFVLKSGRVSPYFFNAGCFNSGEDLVLLGSCYAQAIVSSGIKFDVLFGPAYKGIPLVCATAMALFLEHQVTAPWCFNRKEAKDHGEGGNLVGSPLLGEVMLIDDVITAGTAMRESYEIIKDHGAHFATAVIALDRMEKGRGETGALDEIQKSLGIRVIPIVTFLDLIKYIESDDKLREHLPDMLKYREQYGV